MQDTAPKARLLADLRARLGPMAGAAAGARGVIAPPLPALGPHLAGGGLARGALHQVTGGAGTLFVLALLAGLEGPVLWLPRRADLYAPGLAEAGFDPARLLLLPGLSRRDALWALEEGLKSPALAAAVAEWPVEDHRLMRRLQLAAEAGGVTGFLLHDGPAGAGAVTSWRADPAPAPGDGLPGPGPARLVLELLHARGGRPGSWDIAAAPQGWRLLPAPAPARPATRPRRRRVAS